MKLTRVSVVMDDRKVYFDLLNKKCYTYINNLEFQSDWNLRSVIGSIGYRKDDRVTLYQFTDSNGTVLAKKAKAYRPYNELNEEQKTIVEAFLNVPKIICHCGSIDCKNDHPDA